MECIICGSHCLEDLNAPRYNKMVIGDKRVSEGYFQKVICKDCGCIQSLQDEKYKKEIELIYRNYEPIAVPAFRKQGDPQNNSRLQIICQKMNEALGLARHGNVLEIGCGCGEWLTYFHQIKPCWNLYGMDICEHFRDPVLSRSQVKAFFTSIDEVKKCNIKYDLVVINYALCVCGNAIYILNAIHDILSFNGVLFIIDTDFTVHPYQFNIIEHTIHFNKDTLYSVLGRTKWEVFNTKFQNEKKDVWAFAKKGKEQKTRNLYEHNKDEYAKCLAYLNRVVDEVENCINNNDIVGIWGTSIAGIWVSEIISECAASGVQKSIFFIDEDEETFRSRTHINGFPIYRVEEIVDNAAILLPFPDYVASSIKERYDRHSIEFIMFK